MKRTPRQFRALQTLMWVSALSLLSLHGCKKADESDSNVALNENGEEAATALTVYSGRAEELIGPLLERYEEQSRVELQVRYADSGELAATILEEGARSPADVFIAQDVTSLGVLAERDLLATLPEDVLNRVPERFRGADGRWVGLSGRARVLAYNTDNVAEETLPTIDELADEAWRGRVGWAPENASFQSFVAAMIELRGEEATRQWLRAVNDNDPREYPSNTPMVRAVGSGEIDLALTNHYYLHRLKDELGEDFPVANHYFRSGGAESLVNLSGAGVLSTTEHAEEAAALLANLLQADAQQLLTERNFEFPVIDGVDNQESLPEPSDLNAPRVNYGALEDLETTLRVLREVGLLL